MVFTHDTEVALQSAVALVNSACSAASTPDPRADAGTDALASLADLDAWYAEYQFTGARDHDEAELDSVRALRPLLRRLLDNDEDTTVAEVNAVLADRRAVPQLVRHDHWDYHLHAVDAAAPLADRIAVETAMAMVDVVRAGELSRLTTCADEDCDGIVLDLSRNRSRIYCSTTCGNRNAVAAYRARQRDA